MLFSDPKFLFFFVLVWLVYWGLRSHGLRKHWLLLCSYYFYGSWDWRFLGLIFGVSFVNYYTGNLMTRARAQGGKGRRWLVLSIVVCLGVLGFFKYFNFFISSGITLFHWLGLPCSDITFRIILPVGISFFTFQAMSYTIDVYRGVLKPVDRLTDFLLYVAFFPQLVAGPIVRAVDFLPQLTTKRTFAGIDFQRAFGLFLSGFIKKACIADGISVIVDQVFNAPAGYGPLSLWLASLLYAVQIYCDFSGYSDMAIACARMLGFELRLNFKFPYFSRDITEFWRRWHISLSSWLRDYLYIPLGGNRGGRYLVYRNLMLTMLLGGLWHGAGWNFVIWGAIHGIALALHKLIRERRPQGLVTLFPFNILGTLAVVCLAWVFFRARSLEESLAICRGMLLLGGEATKAVDLNFYWLLPPLVIAHWIASTEALVRLRRFIPEYCITCIYGILFYGAFLFVPLQQKPFIYFQF